jgi:hypothetical protein
MSIATVGRHYGVKDTTIHFNKKNEDNIRGSDKINAPVRGKILKAL